VSKIKLLLSYPFPEQCIDPFRDQFDITRPTKKLNYDEVKALIPDFDAFFTLHVHVDEPMYAAAKKLVAVANFGVGYDHIDVETATKYGIPVITTPTTVTQATAEHSVALIVDVMRGISRFDREMRRGEWCEEIFPDRCTPIKGSTLGILGFGRIGRDVAEQAAGLGMKVIYYDKFRAAPEVEERYGVTYMSFEDVLRTADAISLNMPYTPENHHLMNAKTIAMMKPTAYLVNAARGPVVDEKALAEALKNNVIKGAGLDVFENEPYPLPELLTLENVVLTPHQASNPLKTRLGMCTEAMEGLSAFFKGEKTYHVVNPDVYGHLRKL